MRVVWSHEAAQRLLDVETFIGQDSPARAVRFVDDLIDQVEAQLTTNPRSGRMVPELVSPDLRELIFRGYRIVYRLSGEEAVVLTIFEGHRQLRRAEIDG